MATTNEEILRFANWWISASCRFGWREKQNEFINTVINFQDERKEEILVIVVDQFKYGSIDKLENIPYYTPGNSVCCVYQKED